MLRHSCCALYAARHDRGSIISPISVHSAAAIRVGTALRGVGRTAQQAQPTNGQRRSAATLDEPVSGSRSGFRTASTRVWDDQEVHGVWFLVLAWVWSKRQGCSVSLLYCRWISVCSSVYSPCAQSANLELIHAMHEPRYMSHGQAQATSFAPVRITKLIDEVKLRTNSALRVCRALIANGDCGARTKLSSTSCSNSSPSATRECGRWKLS